MIALPDPPSVRLARFGPGPIHLCPSGGEAEAVAPLPPAALRLDERAIHACRRFGIETIGELAALARGPLARRFGNGLLLRLDQAHGRAAEPIDPLNENGVSPGNVRSAARIAPPSPLRNVLGIANDEAPGT